MGFAWFKFESGNLAGSWQGQVVEFDVALDDRGRAVGVSGSVVFFSEDPKVGEDMSTKNPSEYRR